jgi:hypothetical protein
VRSRWVCLDNGCKAPKWIDTARAGHHTFTLVDQLGGQQLVVHIDYNVKARHRRKST